MSERPLLRCTVASAHLTSMYVHTIYALSMLTMTRSFRMVFIVPLISDHLVRTTAFTCGPFGQGLLHQRFCCFKFGMTLLSSTGVYLYQLYGFYYQHSVLTFVDNGPMGQVLTKFAGPCMGCFHGSMLHWT